MSINVRCEVDVIELDGKETYAMNGGRPKIVIESHWRTSQLVTVEVDGKRYALRVGDVQAAIQNASSRGTIA